jgi:hypothetical protein
VQSERSSTDARQGGTRSTPTGDQATHPVLQMWPVTQHRSLATQETESGTQHLLMLPN